MRKGMKSKYLIILFYCVSFLIYLALSLLIWGFPSVNNLDKIVLGFGGDPFQFIWGLKWGLYSIINGINPFVSFKELYPVGANLAWSAGNSFSADFLFLPITSKFGAIFSYNLWVILSPALGAISALSLNYYITRNYFSSFIGGYIFGFSSYEIGQLLGHLHLFGGIFLIPLLVLISLMFYQNKISKFWFLLFSSLFLLLMFGFGLEIFTSFTLFAFIVVLIVFIIDKHNRKKLTKFSKYAILSYIITIVILIPYLYYIYLGLPFVPKAFHSASVYSSDPLNYIIPTSITWLGGKLFSPISTHFTGNFSEEGAYLGIPLIVILIIFINKCNNVIPKKILLWSLAIVFLCSLGPYLNILGHHTLPLPWWIVDHIPIIANLLPTRFTLYVFLIVSIIASIVINKIQQKSAKYLLSIACLVFLFPNVPMYSKIIAKPKIPAFFTQNIYKKHIPNDQNVLIIPFGYFAGNYSALYQEKADMYFNMTDNTSLIVPLRKWQWENSPVLDSLTQDKPQIIDPYPSLLKAFIGCNKVQYVILTPEEYKKWNNLLELTLNVKPQFVGEIYLYKVPHLITNLYNNVNCDNITNNIIPEYYFKLFTTLYSSSQKFLSDGGNPSKLYPKHLEENGYLPKSFGYRTGPANNWTNNGGWIGQWGCPDGKGKCFGIGVVGSIDEVKPIIDSYKSQALQIFFPYPKLYNPNSSQGTGQLLMIFRDPEPKKNKDKQNYK